MPRSSLYTAGLGNEIDFHYLCYLEAILSVFFCPGELLRVECALRALLTNHPDVFTNKKRDIFRKVTTCKGPTWKSA